MRLELFLTTRLCGIVFGLAVASIATVAAPIDRDSVASPPSPPTPGNPATINYDQPTYAILSDGRRLAFYCAGHGSPVVVFEAGLGMSASAWRKVQPAVAQRTTACAYDRAGYGHSDGGPLPRDAAHVVADLRAGLALIGLRGPYVLVAHSLGAYDAQLFANRHRDDVAAMVLVDPEVDEASLPFRRASASWAKMQDIAEAENRTCIGAAADGRMKPGDPAYAQCGSPPPNSPLTNQAMARAVISEDDSQLASYRQVLATRRGYGTMPLIVLTAGARAGEDGLSAQDRAALHQVWLQGHETLANLSSTGVHRIVDGAPHMIHFSKPDAVIDAVSEVLANVARSPIFGQHPPPGAGR